MKLPTALYDRAGLQALDTWAVQQGGVSGETLMRRAGGAAFEALRQRWPSARHIAVVCGSGNNAGDGYVVAMLASQAGLQVTAITLGDVDKLSAPARACYHDLLAAGVQPSTRFDGTRPFELIVDALLGIGLDRDLDGRYAEAVNAVNAHAAPVLSIDIPSGLDASTGRCWGLAVQAACTVTFVGLKQGFFTGAGPQVCGDIVCADIAVPSAAYDAVAPTGRRFAYDTLAALPRRPRSAHKGHHGHVLVIGGAPGFAGAARLTAEAAARSGAGLVSVACHPDSIAVIASARPELMVHGITTAEDLTALLARATVFAIGPGLGQDAWGTSLFARVLERSQAAVVDADALNLLAREPVQRDNWILTPHPGEAARLLECAVVDIEADRCAAARQLQRRYGGVAVLKGAGSLVAHGDCIETCSAGNPGMGTGGMGDVLTGVIAGLVAQGFANPIATRYGVAVHAAAADLAARGGERGTLASDLFPYLRQLFNHGVA